MKLTLKRLRTPGLNLHSAPWLLGETSELKPFRKRGQTTQSKGSKDCGFAASKCRKERSAGLVHPSGHDWVSSVTHCALQNQIPKKARLVCRAPYSLKAPHSLKSHWLHQMVEKHQQIQPRCNGPFTAEQGTLTFKTMWSGHACRQDWCQFDASLGNTVN